MRMWDAEILFLCFSYLSFSSLWLSLIFSSLRACVHLCVYLISLTLQHPIRDLHCPLLCKTGNKLKCDEKSSVEALY